MKAIEGTNYRIVRSAEQLLELKEDWERLLRPEASPFSTFGWNLAWLRAYGGMCSEVLVFVYYSGAKVTAIAPLYRRVREIRFIGDETCDYQDVIAATAEKADEVLEAVVDYAVRNGQEMRAPRIATNTFAYEYFSGPARQSATSCQRRRHYCPVPFMELGATWEAFRAGLSKNLRSDVRRRENRMKREGMEVCERYYAGEAINEEVINVIGELHAANQHRKEGVSLFRDSRFVKMLGEVAADAEVGLHVSVLESDGEAMAFILGFVRNGTYYLYLTAYDERFERYAPGKVSIYRLVKNLIERGEMRVFDFLNGDEAYKYQWTNAEYDVYEFTMYAKTPMNVVKTRALEFKDASRKRVKRVLVQSGIYTAT